jgi:hypothetical protein
MEKIFKITMEDMEFVRLFRYLIALKRMRRLNYKHNAILELMFCDGYKLSYEQMYLIASRAIEIINTKN